MGHIHASSLENPRLQKFLSVLRAAGDRGMTTLEILHATGLCTVPANECRQHGIRIECKRERTTDNGSKVYRYRLLTSEPGMLF